MVKNCLALLTIAEGQRTQMWSSAPSSRLTTIHNFHCKRPDHLFWLPRALTIYSAHTQTLQKTFIHIKIKHSLKKITCIISELLEFFSFQCWQLSLWLHACQAGIPPLTSLGILKQKYPNTLWRQSTPWWTSACLFPHLKCREADYPSFSLLNLLLHFWSVLGTNPRASHLQPYRKGRIANRVRKWREPVHPGPLLPVHPQDLT